MEDITRQLLLSNDWQLATRGDGTDVMLLPMEKAVTIAGEKSIAFERLRKDINNSVRATSGSTHIEITKYLFDQFQVIAKQQSTPTTIKTPAQLQTMSLDEIQQNVALMKSPKWREIYKGNSSVWRHPLEADSLEKAPGALATMRLSLPKGIRSALAIEPEGYYLEIQPTSVAIFKQLLHPTLISPLCIVDDAPSIVGGYSFIGGRPSMEDGLVAKNVPTMNVDQAKAIITHIPTALIPITTNNKLVGTGGLGIALTDDGHGEVFSVGDLRAVHFSIDTERGILSKPRPLNNIHKPSQKPEAFLNDEQFWMEWEGRVIVAQANSLGVNHAFGDGICGCAVSKKAEFTSHNIGKSTPTMRQIVLIGSDGAFDYTDDYDHGHIILRELQKNPDIPLSELSKILVDYATEDWRQKTKRRVDNITIALVEGSAVVIAYDGHGGSEIVDIAVAETNRILESAKINWDKAFLFPSIGEAAPSPGPKEPADEIAYRQVLSQLSPEHQALCFPNVKVWRDYATIHNKIFGGRDEDINEVIINRLKNAAQKLDDILKPVEAVLSDYANKSVFSHLLYTIIKQVPTGEPDIQNIASQFNKNLGTISNTGQVNVGLDDTNQKIDRAR